MHIPQHAARALIWGGRGFIGTALSRHLLDLGWKVRWLTRAPEQPVAEWAHAIERVLIDPDDRRGSFERAVADAPVVFNLAGSSGAVASNRDPLDSLESNCRQQLEFLAACETASHAPHVVFASSRLVYAPAGHVAVSESHPTGPRSIYAAHKLCVEHYHQIAAARGRLSCTVCRISNPYGLDRSAASDKGYGFINGLIQRAASGRPMTLFGDGRQLRDYIHIDDLVAMLRRCAERASARNTVLNLGSGSSIAVRDAARSIQRRFDGGGITCLPWPAEYEAVESGDFVMDIARARTALDYAPQITFDEGLSRVQASLAAPAGLARAAHAHAGTAV